MPDNHESFPPESFVLYDIQLQYAHEIMRCTFTIQMLVLVGRQLNNTYRLYKGAVLANYNP